MIVIFSTRYTFAAATFLELTALQSESRGCNSEITKGIEALYAAAACWDDWCMFQTRFCETNYPTCLHSYQAVSFASISISESTHFQMPYFAFLDGHSSFNARNHTHVSHPPCEVLLSCLGTHYDNDQNRHDIPAYSDQLTHAGKEKWVGIGLHEELFNG